MLNRFQAVTRVNDLFVYEYDTVQYDAADYWRVLDVDAEKDEGDCEDYALTVAWLLAERSRFKFLKMLLTGKFKICCNSKWRRTRYFRVRRNVCR